MDSHPDLYGILESLVKPGRGGGGGGVSVWIGNGSSPQLRTPNSGAGDNVLTRRSLEAGRESEEMGGEASDSRSGRTCVRCGCDGVLRFDGFAVVESFRCQSAAVMPSGCTGRGRDERERNGIALRGASLRPCDGRGLRSQFRWEGTLHYLPSASSGLVAAWTSCSRALSPCCFSFAVDLPDLGSPVTGFRLLISPALRLLALTSACWPSARPGTAGAKATGILLAARLFFALNWVLCVLSHAVESSDCAC